MRKIVARIPTANLSMQVTGNASDHAWCPGPDSLTINRDEVHVWRAALNVHPELLKSLLFLLTEEERARSLRFRFRKDRERFTAARGVLRAIVARYLRVDPSCLQFQYSDFGKPVLSREFDTAIRFNVSHAGELALYAVSLHREVGVDVERIRFDLAYEEIADQFFSPQESSELRALPVERQPEAFFRCWTCKEAFVKAKGGGLSLPLNQFDVSLAPGKPGSLLSIRDDSKEASHWALQELDVGVGYVAALAVEGHGWTLKRWQFS